MMRWKKWGCKLPSKFFAVFVVMGLSCHSVLAQSADVAGAIKSADTSEFGQANEYSNVTTVFDKVEFNIQRLIRDPKDKSNLRLIGQLINGNSESQWIHLYLPSPKLTDELGNEYFVEMWTGIDACRRGEKENYQWSDDFGDCPLDGVSTLLAPGLPVTVSITFAPSETGTFDEDLASVATYLNATFSFVLAPNDPYHMGFGDKRDTLVPYSVVVPQIPIPAVN